MCLAQYDDTRHARACENERKIVLGGWLNENDQREGERESKRKRKGNGRRHTRERKKKNYHNKWCSIHRRNDFYSMWAHNIQIKWTLLKITMLTLSLQIELFRLIDYAWYDWGLCKSFSFKPISDRIGERRWCLLQRTRFSSLLLILFMFQIGWQTFWLAVCCYRCCCCCCCLSILTSPEATRLFEPPPSPSLGQ